jgi:hypothetical protein
MFQPNIISIEAIPAFLQAIQEVIKYTDPNGIVYYLTTANPMHIGLKGNTNFICSSRRPQNLTGTNLERLDDNFIRLLEIKKGFRAEGNFTVFVDLNYHGDYIYSTNYIIISEMNAIVIP